jgi:hypothetical protein
MQPFDGSTPYASFVNTTNSLKLHYNVDNKYSAANGVNVHKFNLNGCLEGDVCKNYNFSVNLKKNCESTKVLFATSAMIDAT